MTFWALLFIILLSTAVGILPLAEDWWWGWGFGGASLVVFWVKLKWLFE